MFQVLLAHLGYQVSLFYFTSTPLEHQTLSVSCSDVFMYVNDNLSFPGQPGPNGFRGEAGPPGLKGTKNGVKKYIEMIRPISMSPWLDTACGLVNHWYCILFILPQ